MESLWANSPSGSLSLLKLTWMNYGWLDPLGRVRRQPHWCSHSRVDGHFGSDLKESSPRWRIVGKREDIVEEVNKDRRGIVDEVVKERRRKQQQQNRLTAAGDRSTARSSRRSVDRPGRPPAVAGDRSTGAVDRRAQHSQRHERSTGMSGRPLGRPPVDRLK